ncbi:hypothetical protein PAEPH01_1111 [Pancytospora epiphaga]|nr:hypothetical protein PAEPH01_1111 [Pancytospora epiphaga]
MSKENVDLYAKSASISSRIIITGAPNATPSVEEGRIDEINADETETFTLEEMKKLILTYRESEKDFLIARVTTPNPDDQTTFYNFYYAAAEINRVLFKFESSRRLLHRMRVKNPLNNTYIVGQVFYYKITPYDVDSAIVNYFLNPDKEQPKVRRAYSAVFSSTKSTSETEDSRERHSKDCSDVGKGCKSRKLDSENAKSPSEIIECVRKGLIPLPQHIPEERTLKYIASYFASDDDFLTNADVRDYFRKNALDENDDFLYEIDRTRNDFLALMDEDSEDVNEGVSDWRRVLSAHASMALALLFVCIVLGMGPGFIILFLPLAAFVIFSFMCSLFYVLICRQSTFDTQAVNNIDDEI